MHTMISSPKLCSSHLFYSVDFILISLSSTAKRFCTSPITVTSELWILSYCVVVTAVNTFALNVTDLSASGQCWSQSWINGRVVPGKGSGVKSVPKQIWGFILCGDRTGADTHAIILLLHLYKQVCCFPACCRTMSIKYRCIFPHNPSLAFFLLLSLWQGIIFPAMTFPTAAWPLKGLYSTLTTNLKTNAGQKSLITTGLLVATL